MINDNKSDKSIMNKLQVGLCPSRQFANPHGGSPFRSLILIFQEALRRFLNTIWSTLRWPFRDDSYMYTRIDEASNITAEDQADGGAGRLELLTRKGQKFYLSYSLKSDCVRIECMYLVSCWVSMMGNIVS